LIDRGEFDMGAENKKKSSSNHKKEDGEFHSKHIKHDPTAESARAVYGLQNKDKLDDHGE
jgi:hypothetical protein